MYQKTYRFRATIVSTLPILFVGNLTAAIEISTADGTGADTFLSNDSNVGPTTTRGGVTILNMRRFDGTRSKQPLFRFDINALPAGVDLTEATISFNFTRANRARTINVYGLIDQTLDEWPEAARNLLLAERP